MSLEIIKNWDPYKYSDEKDKIDIATFNKDFEKIKEINKQITQENDENELNIINNNEDKNNNTIMFSSINNMLIDWKLSFLNVINDILHLHVTKETINKRNFLFYLGMTILIFTIFFYILYSLYNYLLEDKKQYKIIHEYKYYPIIRR